MARYKVIVKEYHSFYIDSDRSDMKEVSRIANETYWSDPEMEYIDGEVVDIEKEGGPLNRVVEVTPRSLYSH